MAFINGQEILFSSNLNISTVEVVQTTGESESTVMSQKSVTQELERRDGAIRRNDNKITNLEQRIDPSLFATDTSIAYTKNVPGNALPYAEILEIGGMTRKSNNLIKFPYVSSSTTINGITFTVNTDGSITVNGTASAGTTYPLWYPSSSEKFGGETYTISGGTSSIALTARKTTSSGANSSWIDSIGTARTGSLSVDEKLASVALYISGGASVNATIYPMLNIGTTALPYEQYFDGLRNTIVTKICSRDVNSDVIDTFEIPQGVQTLEGYGVGLDESTYNYIDCSNKKFVRVVEMLDGEIRVLNTPIITDISELISADNFIKVEVGGSIVLESEYGFDAPSTITYQLEV